MLSHFILFRPLALPAFWARSSGKSISVSVSGTLAVLDVGFRSHTPHPPATLPFGPRGCNSSPLSGMGCNIPRLLLGPGVPVTAPHLSPGCGHQCPGWKGPHWLDRQAPEWTSVWPSGAWTHSPMLPSTQTVYLSQSACTEAWWHQQTPSRTGGNMSRAQGMLILVLQRQVTANHVLLRSLPGQLRRRRCWLCDRESSRGAGTGGTFWGSASSLLHGVWLGQRATSPVDHGRT